METNSRLMEKYYLIMAVLSCMFLVFGVLSIVRVKNKKPHEVLDKFWTWDICNCSGNRTSYAAGITMIVISVAFIVTGLCVYSLNNMS